MSKKHRTPRKPRAVTSPEDTREASLPRGWVREAAIALALLTVTAVVFTWPLCLHLGDAIPTGSRPPTVALFGLFTAEWTAEVLEHGHAYWDAPVFHPHAGTFAWSESQSATSLLIWLVSRATGTVLAYNLVLLGYLVATGLAGYALARQLTEDRAAALWAALWLTAGAFPIQQITILHLLAGAFPVACLALLLALARRPSLWLAGAAGAAYFLTLTTCAQFGLFFTLLLPLLVLPLLWGRRVRWRTAGFVTAPLAAGLLAALPLLISQRARLGLMGFERSLADVQGAYTFTDLFLPARGHWLTSRLLYLTDTPGAYPFDLGVTFLVCLLAAGWIGGFRFWQVTPSEARQRVAVVAMSVSALLLGFGPNLGMTAGGERVGPYVWLRAVVPGLDAVRTPSRFGMFAAVGIAVLAAAAFAFLRARTRAGRPRMALTTAGFVLLLAEMWALPIGLEDPARGIEDHREVVHWLRDHGRGGAVLELPMAEGRGETALASEVRAMRRALRHGNPIVNGYSGYFPAPYVQLTDAVRTDPAGRGRRYAAALGVRHVLIHDHEYGPVRTRAMVDALGGQVVFDSGRDSVVRLAESGVLSMASLPATARFRDQPRRGSGLGVPLLPVDHARFIPPAPDRMLRISWPDPRSGLLHTRDLRMLGSLLVDAGAPGIVLRVLVPPTPARPGRAVLMTDATAR